MPQLDNFLNWYNKSGLHFFLISYFFTYKNRFWKNKDFSHLYSEFVSICFSLIKKILNRKKKNNFVTSVLKWVFSPILNPTYSQVSIKQEGWIKRAGWNTFEK